MCDAWNDKRDKAEGEENFLLPYSSGMHYDTTRFAANYNYLGLRRIQDHVLSLPALERQQLIEHPDDYRAFMKRGEDIMLRIDEWNTYIIMLERTHISGSEYWVLVDLLEELIDIVDGDTDFTLSKMQYKAPNKNDRQILLDILNEMTRFFILFRDDVIKNLHSSIDQQRQLQGGYDARPVFP